MSNNFQKRDRLRWLIMSTCLLFILALASAGSVQANPSHVGFSAPSMFVDLVADPASDSLRIPPSFVSADTDLSVPGAGLQAATFNVIFNPASCPNATTDWPEEAAEAFTYATNIWGSLIASDQVINVNACWSALSQGILGSAGATTYRRDFTGAPEAGTWYPIALANELAGFDLDPGQADITASFSSAFTNWYFGVDGNAPAGQYDFATVILHEVGHGLGFAGFMQYSNGTGGWGLGSGFPSTYDLYTENGDDQSLLDTSLFPNPSATLGSELTGGDLFFDGPNVVAANGGPAQLYAPAIWNGGSSYSHLGPAFDNTPNALMTYSLSPGEVLHDPGPVGMGILLDVGWEAAPAATGTVEVEVWDDLNKNGIKESGEPGIDGVVVNMIDTITKENIPGVTDTTNNGGIAVLEHTPGLFQFQVILPSPDVVFTLREQGGDDDVDSDVGRFRGRSPQFTIVAGETVDNFDAGIITTGAIEVDVFEDVNNNGFRDAGEPGLFEVPVVLIDPVTKESITGVLTDIDGVARIAYAPGTYQFQVEAPEGYAIIRREQGGDDEVDSDVGSFGGRSPQFTLIANETITTIDAGLIEVGTIEAKLWLDDNENGIQDAGELPAIGIPVTLINTYSKAPIGNPILTGADGTVSFSARPGPYQYQVLVFPNEVYELTLRDRGTDDLLDSDIGRFGGRSPRFTLLSGETITDIDAGLLMVVPE